MTGKELLKELSYLTEDQLEGNVYYASGEYYGSCNTPNGLTTISPKNWEKWEGIFLYR